MNEAYENAWSIENMEAHGAAGRDLTYIGSTQDGNLVTDYYQDNTGAYWYETCGIRNGAKVPMDVYLFGRKIKKKKKKG